MCVTLEKLKFLGFTDIYALDVKWEKSVQKLADEKYIYILQPTMLAAHKWDLLQLHTQQHQVL